MSKIAILIDSCTDVPAKAIQQYGMYVVPIVINYQNASYRDGVDITPQEVCDRLTAEVPKTSLPSGADVAACFEQILQDGYDQAIAVTISSGLSGTYNLLRLMAENYPALDCRLIDTKNIGIGAGFTALLAAQLVENGLSLDEIEAQLLRTVKRTKVFFCPATLEYLRRGGRIGFVTATVGGALGIKPIISCNENGVYYTVQKTRGRAKAIAAMVEHILDIANRHTNYNLAVVNVSAEEEGKALLELLKQKLKSAKQIFIGTISPALIVHTGPGMLGVGIQVLDEA